MKSRRKHSFQFMTILYFVIVFCMCVSRFNVIMTIMGGQLTRVEGWKKLIYCRSIVLEKTCNMVAILFHGTCFITW